MTQLVPSKISKIVLVLAGLGIAAVSVGATTPDYPDTGKGDQIAAHQNCDQTVVDQIRVCVSEAKGSAGVTVITVAPGLTIVD
jgi:hypothetical protein